VNFFVFLAHPNPSHDEYGAVERAYVSCWVNEPAPAQAEARARTYLEGAGWDIEELDDSCTTSVDAYAAGDPGRTYAAEAVAHGLCAVFHSWPVEATDRDDGR
jgi:hypothetical protein